MKTTHTLLVLAMLATQSQAWALETIADQDLSSISGADGIVIQTQSDQVAIDQLFYQDKYGSSPTGGVAAVDSTLFARFDNVKIAPVTSGQTLGSTIKINTGSSAGGVSAFNFELISKPSLFTAERFYGCTSATGAAGTNCTGTGNSGNINGGNSGEWAIKSSGLGLNISSTDGLLNKNASARVKVIIDQMDVFITEFNGSTYNQIILGDIRANIDASGKIWVDAVEGLRFQGDVSLESATNGDGSNYRAGIQLSLKQKGNVGDATTPAAARYDSASAGNLIRFGASGNLKNVDFSLRGTDDQTPDTSKTFGRVDGSSTGDSIVGSSGIALRAKGEFARGTMAAGGFSYEIGEAGSAGRSLRFSDMVEFSNIDGTGNATFDLGNLYIDLFNSTKIGLPMSSKLSSALKFNTIETALADANGLNYLDLMTGNCTSSTTGGTASCTTASAKTVTAGMLAIGIRGLTLQGLARKTEFINNNTGVATSTINGSLVTVVNNLNGNIVFYGDNSKAGFGLSMSTEGLSADNKSSTSILIGDTAGKKYIGLRNLDFLLQTSGTIEMNGNSIHVSLPKALLAFAGEVAAGNLMTASTNFSSDSSVTGNSKKDVLFGIRGKLDANNVVVDLTPGTSGGSALGLRLDLNLARVLGDSLYGTSGVISGTRTRAAGSFLQIVEPSDGSVLGFENISGHLTIYGVDAVTSPDLTINLTDNSAVFEGKILINGTRNATGVRTWGSQVNDLRVGNINFYPTTGVVADMANPQRLGEIAMPGGEIYAKITLKPN
jgi:hypothetical protein